MMEYRRPWQEVFSIVGWGFLFATTLFVVMFLVLGRPQTDKEHFNRPQVTQEMNVKFINKEGRVMVKYRKSTVCTMVKTNEREERSQVCDVTITEIGEKEEH